ncbi:MAG: EAL domain-containing protein [Halothiobacillaceae bacterium]
MATAEMFAVLYLSGEVNDAVQLASALRNAGHHANVLHARDLDAAFDQARKHDPHVTVVELGNHSVEMVEAMISDSTSPFRERSVIVALEFYEPPLAEAAIQAGARDVVLADSDLLFRHAILREVEAAQTIRALDETRHLLRGAEGRCQKLIDGSSEPVAYVLDGLHIYANQAYLDLLECASLAQLEDEPLLDHVVHDELDRLRQFLREDEASESFTLVTREGNHVQAQLSSIRASYEGEECLQIFAKQQVNQEGLEQQMQFLSQRDLLTGLYNRNFFFDRIKTRLEELRSGGDDSGKAGLFHVEVANIEEMRKHVGTTGIDSFLTDYGKALEALAGEEALVARHGAYSFLILVNELDGAVAETRAKQLCKHAQDFIFSTDQVSITISVGVGVILIDSNSPGVMELIDRLEKATQEAMGKGRNQYAVYRPDIRSVSRSEQEEEWARRLRSALKDNRFFMVYQPIISLGQDREHNRFEVFLRMLDEEGQELSPSSFIMRAERTELIIAIDRWLVLSSLKKISDALRKGERMQLYIRISVQSLQEGSFAKWLSERLAAVRLPEPLLFIQVRTEDAGYLIKQLTDLGSSVEGLGCELVLDGFGDLREEQSLLGYLKPGLIKTSRALMNNFVSNPDSQEMVRSILDMGHDRDIKVVVPNVEDAGTMQMLWTMGVDFVQGDFIQSASDSADFDFSSI